MSENQPPVDTIRLNGLKASIWRNTTDNGVMYNTTILRVYRDRDGNYHDTASFGERDLPSLGALANLVISRVKQLRQAEPDRESQAQHSSGQQNQR